MFVYTVQCTFREASVADAWVKWLREEHLDDVCKAGALKAQVVRMDGDMLRIEVRYRFASRASFRTYEKMHAPRLRAEGLARFPIDMGLSYVRTTGEMLFSHPQTQDDDISD